MENWPGVRPASKLQFGSAGNPDSYKRPTLKTSYTCTSKPKVSSYTEFWPTSCKHPLKNQPAADIGLSLTVHTENAL